MNKKKYVFSFFADEEVSSNYRYEAQSALHGACDTVLASGMNPNIMNKSKTDARALSDVVSLFRQPNGQININNMYQGFNDTNFISTADPKFILLSSDLTPGENYNFIYGFGVKETGLVVESLHRFKNIGSAACHLAVRHIASHEMGHMLGLDSDTMKKVDQNNGHCANECTMSQVNNLQETLDLAQRLKNRRLAGFCLDCAGVLRDINS